MSSVGRLGQKERDSKEKRTYTKERESFKFFERICVRLFSFVKVYLKYPCVLSELNEQRIKRTRKSKEKFIPTFKNSKFF